MPVQKDIQSRLKRLFSRQVLIKRLGKDKLKVMDLSRSQSNPSTNSIFDRYRRMHVGSVVYGQYPESSARMDKLNYYADYEVMDNDPIISSALDVLSDETTIKSPSGDILKISTENDKIKSVLENLFYDILNIEHNMWSWIRNLCKYGDYYLYLDLVPTYGVKNVIPITPYIMRRDEGYDNENLYAYRFIIDDTAGGMWSGSGGAKTDRIFEAYQIAHFRLLSDTNFLPYGKSMIENARKEYKKLALMEDAMMLFRIMRAPERRIFKIEVGNLPPESIDAYMEEIKMQMQKTPYVDPNTGEYNLRYNLLNALEDFFVPVRGGNSATSIDTLPGLASSVQIEDVEYFKSKVISALKVPPAFLGYSTDLGGRATLAALDIRFARTIERLQNVMVSELKKIAVIHLYIQGFGDNSVNFDLSLSSPSIVYERQKVEFMTEQMTLVESMLNNKIFSNRYIYETVFGLSKNEWTQIQNELKDDEKFTYKLDQIKSNGADPDLNIGMPKPSEPLDSEDTEDTKNKTELPKSKINAGYDEDGRQEADRVTKPEKNPLGPDFYGKGVLNTAGYSPEEKMITGKLHDLFNMSSNIIQENLENKKKKIIKYLDESNLKEF